MFRVSGNQYTYCKLSVFYSMKHDAIALQLRYNYFHVSMLQSQYEIEIPAHVWATREWKISCGLPALPPKLVA